jgi:hypothetical protein
LAGVCFLAMMLVVGKVGGGEKERVR